MPKLPGEPTGGGPGYNEEQFSRIMRAVQEGGLDNAVGEEIEKLSGEEQLNFALQLIKAGLGLSVAKNIGKFNKSNRETLSDILIDEFRDLKEIEETENKNN